MDIEAVLIAKLGAALDVPVLAEVPANRPASFVTVERVGGGANEWGTIDRPLVAVQSWAGSRYDASQLAQSTDTALLALTGTYPLGLVERISLTNFPSPDGIPRYQGSYQITAHNV